MSDTIAEAIAPAASYQTVGSSYQATTNDTPQMTFVWSAEVQNSMIVVTVSYGLGTSTGNQQQAQIPWGSGAPIVIPGSGSSSQIYVLGSVSAVYCSDGSVIVNFSGQMLAPFVNNIPANGTVAACIVQG